MTASTVETARDGGGGGESLRGLPVNTFAQGVSGEVMAQERSDTPSIERRRCLPISPSAIESSERPTAVVGHSPSGKSRISKTNLLSVTLYRNPDMRTRSCEGCPGRADAAAAAKPKARPLLAVCAMLCLFTAQSPAHAALTVTVSDNGKSIGRYDIYEITMKHAGTYGNPWQDVTISVAFTNGASVLSVVI